MKKETVLLLEKARRALDAARMLLAKQDPDFAASRAYYAMFYAAEAALLERGQSFSKHAGVISGFYHEFIASGELPKELHQWFHAAADDRSQGDYGFLEAFPEAEAERILKEAGDFVAQVGRFLGPP